MNESRLPPEMEATLRSQVIDLDRPGTLLRDFQLVLDFIGAGQPCRQVIGVRMIPAEKNHRRCV